MRRGGHIGSTPRRYPRIVTPQRRQIAPPFEEFPMRSTRLSPVLLAACLAAATSCSDSTTSTTTPDAQPPIVKPPTLVTLTGVIRTGGGLDQLRLDVAGGGVLLGGSEAV